MHDTVSSLIDRRNLWRVLARLTRALVVSMRDVSPMFVGAESRTLDSGALDHDHIVWCGNRDFVSTAAASMKNMCADPDQSFVRQMRGLLVLVADGSGTECFKLMSTQSRTLSYCFWKKEYQMRWYIVVDMHGHIVFVSSVYAGKLDDTKILYQSAFYR